jgi:hypothetical protein
MGWWSWSRQGLVEAGFSPGRISIDCVPADRPHRKYTGIMMALANKTGTARERMGE